MTSKELIFQVMARALLDMRIEAYEIKNSRIFHLADLMHNLPRKLNRVVNGEITYDEVLAELESRAEEKGISGWMVHAEKEVRSQHR